MGAFRQKKRNAPVFLSEPYETVSLRKKINILKEKNILLKETFNCRIICKRFVMSVKGDSLKTLGVNRGALRCLKTIKPCK